jgi:hypothetical protein
MDSKLLHDMCFLGLERRVEGDPDVLIDDGVVQPLRS